MNKVLIAAALLMGTLSAPVFAADVPAKPVPAATADKPVAKPVAMKPAAKPKMMHKKMMPMKASVVKPAREPSTDKLNQQQLDSIKKS
jgi:hypothetical protein